MKKWQYDITSYSIEQVRAIQAKRQLPTDDRPVMFCTDKGACFFDNIPNANIQALLHILDTKGAEGWELVSVQFRSEEMVCFWKKSTQQD